MSVNKLAPAGAGLFDQARAEGELHAILYTDGASRGNPGASGWGAVIFDARGGVIAESFGALPDTTNNVAEYTGVVEGIKLAVKHGVTHLEVRADSKLLICQITGEYKIKAMHLLPYARQARAMLEGLAKWSARHVPREQNKHADRLSNLAADEAERVYHGKRY